MALKYFKHSSSNVTISCLVRKRINTELRGILKCENQKVQNGSP